MVPWKAVAVPSCSFLKDVIVHHRHWAWLLERQSCHLSIQRAEESRTDHILLRHARVWGEPELGQRQNPLCPPKVLAAEGGALEGPTKLHSQEQSLPRQDHLCPTGQKAGGSNVQPNQNLGSTRRSDRPRIQDS